jgi:hypothetical protein
VYVQGPTPNIADGQLFAECKPDSNSPLCVDHPDEIGRVIGLVGLALVIKGCLTIVTFGIKLPGMSNSLSCADDQLGSSSLPWLLELVSVGS